MSHTQDFLREIADKAGLRPSGYAIAKHMNQRYGWSQNTVLNYLKGATSPDDRKALDIATELELDPMYVIACAQADRATDLEMHRLWEGMADRLRRTAAAVILSAAGVVSGWVGIPGESMAYTGERDLAPIANSPHYAHWLRRLARWLAAQLAAAGDELAASPT